MKKYKLKGGGIIKGATDVEIVEDLFHQSFNFQNSTSTDEYILEVASACKVDTGAIIRTFNAAVFVQDLIENGYLEQLSEN